MLWRGWLLVKALLHYSGWLIAVLKPASFATPPLVACGGGTTAVRVAMCFAPSVPTKN